MRPLATVITVFLAGGALAVLSRADDPPWVAPARAARKRNPTTADARSIAAGREVYTRECASCHGASGRGDGPAARDLQKSPGDLTSAATQQQSDGALFWKTTEGRSPMPSFAKLLSDEERWHVVNFMRTLASQQGAVTPPEHAAPAELRQALSRVFSSYAAVARALAADDAGAARTAAEGAKREVTALAALDARALPREALGPWIESKDALVASFEPLTRASDLAGARAALKPASEALTTALARFGHAEGAPLHVLHCSMANAGWLQASREPANPYYGRSMATCGEVERSLGAERAGGGGR